MKNLIYMIVGRFSLFFDFMQFIFFARNNRQALIKGRNEFDGTGILVKKAKHMKMLWNDSGSKIMFVEYERLSHSLWRSQEFSLFWKYKDLFLPPVMDLGCGDGTFTSVLFDKIDYGVDNDIKALEIAADYDMYKNLVQSSDTCIPVDADKVKSVISNSVLEHLTKLDVMLQEVYRVLRIQGVFAFTVPVLKFKYDLKKYFGKRESERVNHEYCHRNLLSVDEWNNKLSLHGFTILSLKHYQPDWFTFWYRMFRLIGSNGFGMFIPNLNLKIWNHFKSRIINMVVESINIEGDGANIFIIAQKR